MACVNGEFYHLVNRGVDGRKVFSSRADYERFRSGLLLFNSEDFTRLCHASEKLFLKRFLEGKVNRYVDVIAYCLLDNHFHIFVRQRLTDGVEYFLRKLVGGYTKYFDIKYKRKGVLFQGHTKIIHVGEENYFAHLPHYIVLNSLDGFDRKWREHTLKNTHAARKRLLTYPYSSLNGMLDEGTDPILSDELVSEVIDRENFMDELVSWSSEDYGGLENLALEV